MIHKGLPGLEAPNPEYARAVAPANTEFRAAWVSLQSMRERPRAALEEFSLLQIDDPKSMDAAVGRAEIMLALNQYEDARAQVGPLLSHYPEKQGVRNLAQKLEQHDCPQMKIDVTQGKGGSTAAAESVLDATRHSAPLNGFEHYRVRCGNGPTPPQSTQPN
jgi:predicted Zn-dependent protease